MDSDDEALPWSILCSRLQSYSNTTLMYRWRGYRLRLAISAKMHASTLSDDRGSDLGHDELSVRGRKAVYSLVMNHWSLPSRRSRARQSSPGATNHLSKVWAPIIEFVFISIVPWNRRQGRGEPYLTHSIAHLTSPNRWLSPVQPVQQTRCSI